MKATSPTTPKCWCGRSSNHACGLREHLGICGLPDPRRGVAPPLLETPAAKPAWNPNDPLAAARAALARMPRCGAHARTTGAPCKKFPMRGRARCLMHGGRGGRPPIHGKYSLRTQRLRHYVGQLLMVLEHQHRGEKLKPVEVARDPQDPLRRWRPIERDETGAWVLATIVGEDED